MRGNITVNLSVFSQQCAESLEQLSRFASEMLLSTAQADGVDCQIVTTSDGRTRVFARELGGWA